MSTLLHLAHGTIEGVGDLWNGILHPLRSPSHLLLLFALGLYAGQRVRLRLLVGGFLIGSVGGLVFAKFPGVPEPAAYLPSILSGVVGAVVALRKPLPGIVGRFLFAFSGFALGWDSMPDIAAAEESPAAMAFKILLGVWIGLSVLILNLANYAKMAPKRPWVKVAFRVGGSWIMAISVLFLAFAFKR